MRTRSSVLSSEGRESGGLVRTIIVASAVMLVLSACAGIADRDEASDTGRVEAAGALFIETDGMKLCSAVAESYPPQCGGDRTYLLDLRPNTVVALMSPSDPTFAAVTWTDYTLRVTGIGTDDGLTNVELGDPVYSATGDGLLLRVADLAVQVGEPVVFPMDLTNVTDTATDLTFFDGQRAEIVFEDASGDVYRWSADMMFAQSIETITIEAGATVPYVLTGEPIDLPPGNYSAKAWVTANGAENVVVVWTVTVEE
jgi:hypothetical protein